MPDIVLLGRVMPKACPYFAAYSAIHMPKACPYFAAEWQVRGGRGKPRPYVRA